MRSGSIALSTLLLPLLLSAGVAAAEEAVPAPPPLYDNLGTLHHPITTKSPKAQRYFDQGLRLTFAFNHDEAIAAYQEGARIDPDCAMCYWGIALAMGPNINLPMDPKSEPAAHEAAQKAKAFSSKASEAERAYIDALAKRYAADPGADRSGRDRAYADAMREVAKSHPNDADAAALFAEAMMDLHPWDYWEADGRPKNGAEEIVSTLESVLKKDPNHPGACHYYIHTVESSADPARALPCAKRLPNLVPGAGHLVHMPAHTFMRVGMYREAAEANDRAVHVDERYFEGRNVEGFYRLALYPHNLHFLFAAASMEGRSAEAIRAARDLAAKVPNEMVKALPPLELFTPTPLFALARFGKWEEILKEPAPPAEFKYTTGVWRYARGLAFLAAGYEPVRRRLGALLLAAGRPSEAEKVYREDLKRNPNNGWSLYGLKESLKAERNTKEAASVEKRFNRAWRRADVVLTASRF